MDIAGSCGCGAVTFKLSSPPKKVVNCHCNFCRKHNGAAFSTYAVVAETDMEITAGQGHITAFEWYQNGHKHFCSRCGTPIYGKNARYPGLCMVQIGTIAADCELTPAANIYCESALDWVNDVAQIPSFEQGFQKPA